MPRDRMLVLDGRIAFTCRERRSYLRRNLLLLNTAIFGLAAGLLSGCNDASRPFIYNRPTQQQPAQCTGPACCTFPNCIATAI